METLSKSLRSYIFRRRLAGKACPCGIHIPWSKLRTNKGLPQCFLHTIPIDLWRESPIHDRLALQAFRTELLAKRTFYGTHLQEVLAIAFSQSQGHTLTVFRLFAKFWTRPGRGYSHLATQQYYRCLRLGWSVAMDYLRNWKTVHIPQQGYLVPVLQELRSLTNPVIREELRQPVYTKILRAFATETFLTPLRSPWDVRRFQWRLSKVYRNGFAQTIQRYQWRLLGFWTIQVRAKIAHWRQAHTFKPLPPFAPNTEPLDLLVQRNPRRVPQARKEFLRALGTSDIPLLPRDMKVWINTIRSSPVYHEIVKLYGRTDAWRELADFFKDIPQRDMTPQLLIRILSIFDEAPVRYCVYFEEPLRFYLQAADFATGPKAACAMLSAFHPLCQELPTFHWLLHTANVCRYIRNPQVSNTLVDLYMNRAMCVRLSQTAWRDYVAQAFWETPAVQSMYAEIQADATTVLSRFMRRCITAFRAQKERLAQVLEAATPHIHAWTTLAIRWRFQRRPLHGDCPVCMETHILVPLHGERRHGVCRGCWFRVVTSGRCPMCRASLAASTISYVSSISYTSDHSPDYYEDPEYDDDQWYHY